MDFEKKLELFYLQLDLNDSIVIDVGANVGRHTIPLAKKVGKKGAVFAFEPAPLTRYQLNLNLYSDLLNNVVVYPFALANERGVSTFNFIPNLPEESGLKKRHSYNAVPENPQLIEVVVFPLDELISVKTKIAFIKIDVEGGELDVLRGAKQLLRTSRPIVAFESGAAAFLGYHNTPEEFFDIFSSLEYQVFSILGEQILNREHFSKCSYEQSFWDYLALPSEKSELSGLLISN